MFQGRRRNNQRRNPENDWVTEPEPEQYHNFQSGFLLGTFLVYVIVTVPSAIVVLDYILGSRDIQDLYDGLASNPTTSSLLHIVFYGYFVMSLLFTGSNVFRHFQCYGAITTGNHPGSAIFNCWQLDNLQFLMFGVIICTTAFFSYLNLTFPEKICLTSLGTKKCRASRLISLLWFPISRFLSLSLDKLYRWQIKRADEDQLDAAAAAADVPAVGLPEQAAYVRRRIALDAAGRRVRFATRG